MEEKVINQEPKITVVWVVKLVSHRDWNNHYHFDNAYSALGEEDGKTKIGFVLPHQVFNSLSENQRNNLRLMSDDEMRIVDKDRRSQHVAPTPLSELNGFEKL